MKIKKKILAMLMVFTILTGVLPISSMAVTTTQDDITFSEEKQLSPEDIVDDVIESVNDYIKNNDENKLWMIADLISYGEILNKKSLADTLIKDFENLEYVSASVLAKYIIAISGLGYDASQIKLSDEKILNLPKLLLDEIEKGNGTDIYTLPYVIIALQQDKKYATEEQLTTIKEMLISKQDEWMDTQWGVDGITPVVLALSKYYEQEDIKIILDEALAKMITVQKENGAVYAGEYDTYGASSTGLAIVAVASIGIDPNTIKSSKGLSLVDGLIRYYDEETGKIKETNNSFATEQGLRGLISAIKFSSNNQTYRIYDFADVEKQLWAEKVTGDNNDDNDDNDENTNKDDNNNDNDENINKDDTNGADRTPNTGDKNMFMQWSLLFMILSFGVIVIGVKKKSQN